VKESRLEWHLDWLEKEKRNGEVLGQLVGHAGENKEIWPNSIFRVKTFSIFQTIFPIHKLFWIQIEFEFQTTSTRKIKYKSTQQLKRNYAMTWSATINYIIPKLI
jgi:hypothetical protein